MISPDRSGAGQEPVSGAGRRYRCHPDRLHHRGRHQDAGTDRSADRRSDRRRLLPVRLGAGVGRTCVGMSLPALPYFNNSEMDQFSTASLITRSTSDITQIPELLEHGAAYALFCAYHGLRRFNYGSVKCVSLAWVLALALVIMLGLILIFVQRRSASL